MINPSLVRPPCVRSASMGSEPYCRHIGGNITSENLKLKHYHYGPNSQSTSVNACLNPLPVCCQPNPGLTLTAPHEQLQMHLYISFLEGELERTKRARAEAEREADNAHKEQANAEHALQQAIEACLEASRVAEEAILAQMEAEQRAELAIEEAERAKGARAAAEKTAETALLEAEEAKCAQAKVLWRLRRAGISADSTGVSDRSERNLKVVLRPEPKSTLPDDLWRSRSPDKEQDGSSEVQFQIPCTFPAESRRMIDDGVFVAMRERAARREQNSIIKRVVLDSTLVTYGAGLRVEAISCGFDNGIVEIHNLPLDVEADEIGALFSGTSTPFVVTNTWQSGNGTISSAALVKAARKQAVADRICGKTIRERVLRANILKTGDHSAGCWTPRHLLYLTWESSNYNRLRAFCDHLKCLLESSPGLISFEFTACAPAGEHTAAMARFDSWAAAKKAHDRLAGKRLEAEFPTIKCDLTHRPTRHVLYVPLDQHYIHESEDAAKNRKCIVALENKGVIAQISYLGSDWFDGWLWSFDLGTKEFLERTLSRQGSGIHTVVRDWLTRSLTFYAESQQAIDEVSAAIGAVARQSDLAVHSDRINSQFIKSFQEKSGIAEGLGPGTISLDVARSHYVIKYSGGARSSACAVQRQLVEVIGEAVLTSADVEENAICPICLTEASAPIELGCGHVNCIGCLRQYLVTAPERNRFPIVCIGNNDRCRKPIALPIIQAIVSVLDFDNLVEKAVTSHINQHPDDYRYCSTPNCMQVYRCDRERKVLTCPSCLVSVCSTCHGKGHPGSTCPEQPIAVHDATNEQNERLNSQWASRNGVKKCPSCRVWIQKSAGCNHMRCRMCKAHICWVCLAKFKVANDVYDHLRAAHGGIDLPMVNNVGQDLRLAQQLQVREAVQAREIMLREDIYGRQRDRENCVLM